MPYVVAVDDEKEMLATLGRAIERGDMDVKLLNVSKDVIPTVEKRRPDLLILDIMMPELDGITICRKLRKMPDYVDLPILFLTAQGETDDVVNGLDAGADDYIVKPFHFAELQARVNALLRRGSHDNSDNHMLEAAGLSLNSETYQVEVEGSNIQLTSTEHRLLRHLMEYVDKPQSPATLLENVWDYPPDTGDADLVRAHVRNLRVKFKGETGKRIIETVHGVGYLISSDA